MKTAPDSYFREFHMFHGEMQVMKPKNGKTSTGKMQRSSEAKGVTAMGRVILILLTAAFFLVSAQAGPIGGGFGRKVKVPAGTEDAPGSADLDKKVTFQAGQRACVILTGREPEAPPAKLTLLILDEKGKIVASDQGAYNLVAVWYPNRDMTCAIRVLNPDSHDHGVFLSVK